MICFNKDYDPSQNNYVEKLIKLLKSENSLDVESDQFDNDFDNLLEVIYNYLFILKKDQLSLTITKTSNNGLEITINDR